MPSISIPLSSLDPPFLQAAKEEALRAAGLPKEVTFQDSPPSELWDRLRVVCMTETELYFWNPYQGGPVGVVSYWNELKAVKLLRTLLQQQPCEELEKALVMRCEELVNESTVTDEPSEPSPQVLGDLLASAGVGPADMAVEPALFPATTGRGLIFRREVRPPHPVLSIPRSLLFNIDAARQSSLAPVFEQLGLDDDTALMLFLINEKFAPREMSAANGRWAAFLSQLPASYDSPYFWTAEQLAELEGSKLLDEVHHNKEHLRGIHAELYPRLAAAFPDRFPQSIFSFENMLWARTVFDSRAFVINIEGRALNTLIPMADLINHTPLAGHVSYRRFDEASQCLVLDSLGTCKAGVQARMNYGPLQTWELLLYYGFVIDDNPLDTCLVEFELDEEDELVALKQASMEQLRLPCEHMLGRSRDGTPSHKLLAALRIAASESIDELQACVEGSACLKGPVSDDLEGRVAELLGAVVSQLEGAYPTTLEDDERRLHEIRAAKRAVRHTEVLDTPAEENALVYRIGQKRLLRQARLWAEFTA